jgi:hypothetical protein
MWSYGAREVRTGWECVDGCSASEAEDPEQAAIEHVKETGHWTLHYRNDIRHIGSWRTEAGDG